MITYRQPDESASKRNAHLIRIRRSRRWPMRLVRRWSKAGHLWEAPFPFFKDAPGLLNRAYRKYGPVFRLRALWIKYTIIGGNEADLFMQRGLQNRYLSREKIFQTIGEELGTSDFMMSQSGPAHLRLAAIARPGLFAGGRVRFRAGFCRGREARIRKVAIRHRSPSYGFAQSPRLRAILQGHVRAFAV